METLTPEEGLVLTRLIEDLKQYPRLRLALLEALQLTALLEMPAQLDELKKIVEQTVQRQDELGRTLQSHSQILHEHGERLDRIEKDVSVLKGRSEAMDARKRIPSVFGRLLSKIRIYDPEQLSPIVEEQFELSEDDFVELLSADLFVSGQLKRDGRSVWLVVEVSWSVGVKDVERAHARAAILRRAGVDAYGAVMGQTITRTARPRAQQLGVLVALDDQLYNTEVLNAQA